MLPEQQATLVLNNAAHAIGIRVDNTSQLFKWCFIATSRSEALLEHFCLI